MLNIDPAAPRQTVLTTFEVSPGQCQDLVEALMETIEAFIRHQPGFIAAAVHVNDAQTRVANYSQWRGRDDFLAMLRHPEMRARTRRLSDLCHRFEPVMYDVADVFG
jgi:quinol monooxygenase YgiN